MDTEHYVPVPCVQALHRKCVVQVTTGNNEVARKGNFILFFFLFYHGIMVFGLKFRNKI